MSLTLSEFITYTVKKNQAYLGDNIFFGSQGFSDELTFYSIDRKAIYYSGTDPSGDLLEVLI